MENTIWLNQMLFKDTLLKNGVNQNGLEKMFKIMPKLKVSCLFLLKFQMLFEDYSSTKIMLMLKFPSMRNINQNLNYLINLLETKILSSDILLLLTLTLLNIQITSKQFGPSNQNHILSWSVSETTSTNFQKQRPTSRVTRHSREHSTLPVQC